MDIASGDSGSSGTARIALSPGAETSKGQGKRLAVLLAAWAVTMRSRRTTAESSTSNATFWSGKQPVFKTGHSNSLSPNSTGSGVSRLAQEASSVTA